MSSTHILKFGGTSLQNASFINQAVTIVGDRAKEVRPVVVVSALAGVTDQLLKLSELSPEDTRSAESLIAALKHKHRKLQAQTSHSADREELNDLFAELEQNYFDRESRSTHYGAWRDRILSIGERASARIIAGALTAAGLSAEAIETQHYIKTDDRFGEANILPEATRSLLVQGLLKLDKIPVVTGFIGSTQNRQITTLGRSGSDYTAGLVADALKADRLEIWTDVNGVLTADPKIVPDAQNIGRLSFDDISELSAHGAEVIHPKTVYPVKESNISVFVRNTFNPKHPGTWIHKDHTSNGDFRSITVSGPLVGIEIPDRFSIELAQLLEKSTFEFNQHGSYSYTRTSPDEPARLVIQQSNYSKIQKQLESWFTKKDLKPELIEDLFRLNIFTHELKQSDRPVAQILELLRKQNLHPLQVQRKHGKRYFSLFFSKEDVQRAAQIINTYLVEDLPVVDIFLAGIGAVGGTLLDKLWSFDSDHFKLRVSGICNSRYTLFGASDLNGESPTKKLKQGVPTDWTAIMEKLVRDRRHPTIFVDATGSEEVARRYPELLEAGIHIVTPSKLANTLEQGFYNRIREKASQNHASFHYETTVGAGLPVISTISDLQSSGDSITELSGVVSGTMTYLFNELEKGVPFSHAILEARRLGYAEPDPRDDLSGEDVARKFLTLARETGHSMEREAISVQSLIPEALEDTGLDEFLDRLKEYDEEWKQQFKEAASKEETLRYTGMLKNGEVAIGVEHVPLDSPLGQLKGTDNMLRIHSRNYDQTPIIIQGPGAGREVTATGVMTDILKIVSKIIRR